MGLLCLVAGAGNAPGEERRRKGRPNSPRYDFGLLARSKGRSMILARDLARSTPDEADGIESQSGLGEELEEFVPIGGELLDLG